MLVLLRLEPYPWALSSLLISQIKSVRRQDLVLTTSIALLRCLLYTWIGSELARGAEGQGIWSIVLGEGSGIFAALYIYWVIKHELSAEDIPLDDMFAIPQACGPSQTTKPTLNPSPSLDVIATAATGVAPHHPRSHSHAPRQLLTPLSSSETLYESLLAQEENKCDVHTTLITEHPAKWQVHQPSVRVVA